MRGRVDPGGVLAAASWSQRFSTCGVVLYLYAPSLVGRRRGVRF